MELLRLSENCRLCKHVLTCDHKVMEYFMVSKQEADIAAHGAAMPVLRETVNTIIDGKVAVVYKDEMIKNLYHDIFKSAT